MRARVLVNKSHYDLNCIYSKEQRSTPCLQNNIVTVALHLTEEKSTHCKNYGKNMYTVYAVRRQTR